MKQNRDIQTLEVWSANELVKAGFSRNMAYSLLNRKDIPTLKIGERLFVRREAFQEWLKAQEKIEA